MNFDVPTILVGMLFSGVGFVYMSYGKKMQRFQLMILGIVLMVYPYFVDNLIACAAIGSAMTALPFFLKWW